MKLKQTFTFLLVQGQNRFDVVIKLLQNLKKLKFFFGLIIPVLRNCERLSFADIEKTLIDLAEKGRQGKISADDMVGGTFTISNGGVFGSLMGTPIINAPQSAILGMHAIVNRPVVRNDQIVARPMMYLALTYDHRILDGKDAATFLKKLATSIEDPRRILLDV